MPSKTSDIAIIGAGITGTTAAIFLARHGLKVVLLDKGRVGDEASGRSGGGVRQQFRQPPERVLAMQAPALWQEIQSDWGFELEYIRGGGYRLNSTASSHKEAAARVAREQTAGLEVELLDATQTRAHLPFLSGELPLWGSSYCPGDGTANPLLTMQVLGDVANQNGVQIRTGEPVGALTVQNGRVLSAHTSQTAYQADRFLITAGSWTMDLLKPLGLELPIQRQISRILITEPIAPVLSGFVSFDGGYMRQAADGNFHLGLTSTPVFDGTKNITRDAFRLVAEQYPSRFPFMGDLHIIRAFGGITAWTPDALPVIDNAPGLDNLYVAAGYSAHGFCIGPVAGRHMADWIFNGKQPPELVPFNWQRFNRPQRSACK